MEANIEVAVTDLLAVTSSNLAYFSEAHIRLISQRLGHNNLLDLIRSISNIVNEKLSRGTEDTTSPVGAERSSAPTYGVSEAVLKSYVKSYFDNVHPLYPFLDRKTFEASFQNVETRDKSPAFRALYHCVLALGYQYISGDRFFTLGRGEAWSYFKVALDLLQDVLIPPEALVNLQVCPHPPRIANAVRLTLDYLGGNHCYGKCQVLINHYVTKQESVAKSETQSPGNLRLQHSIVVNR